MWVKIHPGYAQVFGFSWIDFQISLKVNGHGMDIPV
jgi:hypothetical protein